MSARILVVDDDPQIVRLVRSYLEQAGFQVLVAYDGEQALHVLRRERPNCLVLDLMLPKRDGWNLTRLIRADEHLATTPILMLTARVEDTDKLIGLELGADDYVTKPFNPQEVVARVRALLRRAQWNAQLPAGAIYDYGDLRLDDYAHVVEGERSARGPDADRIRPVAGVHGQSKLCLYARRAHRARAWL
jgi:two-component system alkaline phosphatase synthesis response regulator PhoP